MNCSGMAELHMSLTGLKRVYLRASAVIYADCPCVPPYK